MSLVNVIRHIPGADGKWPPPNEMPPLKDDEYKGYRIPKACHVGTSYWLYHAAYGTPPSRDIMMLGGNFAQYVANACLASGQEIQHSITTQAAGIKFRRGGGAVPAGSILIFAKAQNQADHSCVLKGANRIAGYNQTQWFTSPGSPDAYSEHYTTDIDWVEDKHHARQNAQLYKLYAVSESNAISAVRSVVNRFPPPKPKTR